MFAYLSQLRSYRGNIRKFKVNFPQLSLPQQPWSYFGEWRKSLSTGRNPMADRKPWVTISALIWLESNVQEGWTVFEYGMGGSTLYFTDRGCLVTSVEHHKEWYHLVLEKLTLSRSTTAHIEEPSQIAGNPEITSEFKQWKGLNFENYVRIAETMPDESIDLAFVDGRARIQCIKAIMPKVKKGGYLLFDNSERPRYKPGIEMLEKEGWQTTHFAGPGFYEKGKFWCTSLFRKPSGN